MHVRGRGTSRDAFPVTTTTPAVRRLGADDADAMAALATACEVAENGEPDPELVEWILVGSKRPEFHAFGIDDALGLAGFSYAELEAGHRALEVDVRVRPGLDLDVGAPLLRSVREAAAAFDASKPTHVMANSAATRVCRWLESQGGREVRHFWRMAIEFDEAALGVPDAPMGVTVRRARDDEAELRTIFAITDTSFADHFGHTDERTYERWIDHWRSRPGFDLGLWWVAEVDGEPVAVCLCLTFDDATPPTGQVGTLGTLKQARGRGIGTLLLKTAFAEFHARGYRRVTLGVDSENTTGAVRLYESVGMHAVNDWPLYEFPPL
jgi:mycothiol synthase